MIDAIKSGRPRRNKASLIPANREWHHETRESVTYGIAYELGDICADSWEIQEPTVTITRAQLIAAIHDGMQEQLEGLVESKTQRQPLLSEIVARKLGLDP